MLAQEPAPALVHRHSYTGFAFSGEERDAALINAKMGHA